jgi:hypothetical protein
VSDTFDLFVTKLGQSMATAETIQRMLRHYLHLELTSDELSLLNNALIGFYGEQATQGLTKPQFCDFLTKNFQVESIDLGNQVIAKET